MPHIPDALRVDGQILRVLRTAVQRGGAGQGFGAELHDNGHRRDGRIVGLGADKAQLRAKKVHAAEPAGLRGLLLPVARAHLPSLDCSQ